MYRSLILLSLLSLSLFAQPIDGNRNFSLIRAKLPSLDRAVVSYTIDENKEVINPELFKILVWNVFKTKKDKFALDFAKLSQDKDLILIQEYFQYMDLLPNFLTDHLETIIATSFINLENKTETITGVATMSNVKSYNREMVRSDNFEPLINTPKVSLITKYKIKDSEKSLMTINIHAINFVPFKHFKNQIEELRTFIEDHDGPIIFAGDFNTWNDKRTEYLMKVTRSLGFTQIEYKKENLKTFFNNPLDHIFVKGIEVISFKALGNIATSDHKPLTAELRITDY